MTQYIVFPGLLYKGKKDEDVINKHFKSQGWGKVRYKMQFKTLAGQGGEGGRSDVVFAWFAKGSEIGKFSVQRLAFGADAPRWLGDYITNNSSIIPSNVLTKLKKLRDITGDYGAGED